jgi:hypothetical protein
MVHFATSWAAKLAAMVATRTHSADLRVLMSAALQPRTAGISALIARTINEPCVCPAHCLEGEEADT